MYLRTYLNMQQNQINQTKNATSKYSKAFKKKYSSKINIEAGFDITSTCR